MRKTAFVIGTGPSLNDIDMGKLKNYDCVTFNRAYIAFDDWGFVPKYYLAIDGNDIRSVYKDINKVAFKNPLSKFFILDDERYNEMHPPDAFQNKDKKISLFDWERKNLYRIHQKNSTFGGNVSNNDAYLPVVPNAGWMGVELLYSLGYKRVAFVGCDSRYEDNPESNKDITKTGREYISHADTDVNHFRPDYFGKEVHFGKPNASEILRIWKNGSETLPSDLEIISCTKNSALNLWYKYMDFEEFIKKY
tara:strand:- start:6981 stop:7730 length:750 start_codon:yes stop_codon:yes gene_type:complete